MRNQIHVKAEDRLTSRITAFILYEDKTTGFRAKLVLDGVFQLLGIDVARPPVLCRLDLLDWPQFKRRAAKSAAKSDLILLSLYGDRHQKAELFDWAYLWLRRRRKSPQALGILFDQDRRRTIYAQELLHSINFITNAADVTVFCDFRDAVGSTMHEFRSRRWNHMGLWRGRRAHQLR